MTYSTFRQKGFTLMELLIVIAIIGILSTIVLSNVTTAREKARFTKIKLEQDELIKAIETDRASTDPFINNLEIAFDVTSEADCDRFAPEGKRVCLKMAQDQEFLRVFNNAYNDNGYIIMTGIVDVRAICKDSHGTTVIIPTAPTILSGPWDSCNAINEVYGKGGYECIPTEEESC